VLHYKYVTYIFEFVFFQQFYLVSRCYKDYCGAGLTKFNQHKGHKIRRNSPEGHNGVYMYRKEGGSN